MPFPLLIPIVIGAGSVFTTGVGVKKGYDGVSEIIEAGQICKDAEARGQKAVFRVNQKQQQVEEKAQGYGELILNIQVKTFKRFLNLLSCPGYKNELFMADVFSSVDIMPVEMEEFVCSIIKAHEVAKGSFLTLASGAGVAGTAKTLIALYGTASTGTSISGLAGAAATKATLAWLGGGSIATGGGGIALGTLVLGGLTMAPAMLAGGFFIAEKGSKHMLEAKSYKAEVDKQISRLDAWSEGLDSLIVHITEREGLVAKLDYRANLILDDIDTVKHDLNNCRHVQLLSQAVVLIKYLSEIMETPLLDSEGNITDKSREIQLRYI